MALQLNNSHYRKITPSNYKKYFYATSDMYLKIDPSKPAPDSTPELVGQVVTCLSQKNNRQFETNWIWNQDAA